MVRFFGFDFSVLKTSTYTEWREISIIALEEIGKDPKSVTKRMEIIKLENGFKKLKEKDDFEFKIERIESSKNLLSIKI